MSCCFKTFLKYSFSSVRALVVDTSNLFCLVSLSLFWRISSFCWQIALIVSAEFKDPFEISLTNSLNLRLESVYIGGGTPTTLTWEQMELLLRTIRRNFDFSCCREFTVEAGRPDTITPEKLKAMKRYGVDRISINPQTLNDGVLELIGRKHSARQTIDAFKLARKEGFHHINMD